MNISQLARVKEEGPGPPGVPAASELAARGGQGGVFQATQVARPPRLLQARRCHSDGFARLRRIPRVASSHSRGGAAVILRFQHRFKSGAS